MINFVSKGRSLVLAIAAMLSGYPAMKGGLKIVCSGATDAAGNVAGETEGVFDLSVKAVNDSGNSAVAIGDQIFYNANDTPKLSKKQGGRFFGYALEAITSGSTATINVKLADGMGNADFPDGTIKQTKLDRDFIFEEFRSNPATAKLAGGAAAGATGTTNVMTFPDNTFEYHIKGTQTILAPVIGATGLDISMDNTDDDGVELTNGITARSRVAFVIGTSPAFYMKAKLKIHDVSGTDDLAVGFRKAEAYQANIDDYNDMAALNVISGNITEETILNNGATVVTDTTLDWADDAEKTLEIYVSATGVVSMKVDGVAVPTFTTFTFDTGDTVVPFLFFLNATDIADGTVVESWEVGLQ